MKYLQYSDGDKNTFLISERAIPNYEMAAEMHYISGYFSENSDNQVETLGDISAVTVPYANLKTIKELSRDEFISFAVPKILKKWREFVIKMENQEAFMIPSSYVQSRKLVMTILNLDHAGFRAII